MERESLVSDVLVEHEGSIHKASYFVEAGMIHGRMGDRKFLAPVGLAGPEGTVRALVTEQLLERNRKLRHSTSWTGALRQKLPKLRPVK